MLQASPAVHAALPGEPPSVPRIPGLHRPTLHRPVSPHNIAVIVDTTTAMTAVDSECNTTKLECQFAAIRVLLTKLSPCKDDNSACATDGNAANDRVSLFTFPNVTIATAAKDHSCGDAWPDIAPYSFPPPHASSYAPPATPPDTPTYQIVGFSNDYRKSNTTSDLNPDSDLVKALGGKTDCNPMWAPGGKGTYYAGAIYAAQAALVAERAARPDSQNVMILIGNGYTNATQTQMQPGATDSGTYPSWVNQCGQAITASHDVADAGTMVYAVAYDATAPTCPTESSGPYQHATTCQVMQAIATTPDYFFSNLYLLSPGVPCVSNAHPITGLNQMFEEIAKFIRDLKPAPEEHRGLFRHSHAQ
jgi:hypothetical protein